MKMFPATVAVIALAACAPATPSAEPAANTAAPTTVAETASDPVAPATSEAAAPASPSSTAPVEPPPASTTEPEAPPAAAADSGVYATADVAAWMKEPELAPGNLVFLTFDDGPNYSITPLVLDALKAADVNATFFVLGSEVPDAPDVLQRTVDEGNAIALHSQSHDYKKMYPGRHADAERVAWEFDETMAAVRGVLGEGFTTTAWRYPGGHMSWKSMEAADAALDARGATWLDWNSMTGDAEPKNRRPTTVSAMVSMATEPISYGQSVAVVLAHDSGGKDMTVDALPAIIDAYKAAGYEFGTLS